MASSLLTCDLMSTTLEISRDLPACTAVTHKARQPDRRQGGKASAGLATVQVVQSHSVRDVLEAGGDVREERTSGHANQRRLR